MVIVDNTEDYHMGPDQWMTLKNLLYFSNEKVWNVISITAKKTLGED